MAEFQVRDLQRHELENGGHFYSARLVIGTLSVEVDNLKGSWRSHTRDGIRDLRPDVAAVLQAKLPAVERKVRAKVVATNG